MNDYYVYCYRDLARDEFIYVGKGRKKRAYHHLKLTGTGYFSNYLRGMLAQGNQPDVSFLAEELSEKEAFALEIFWIAVLGRKDKGRGSLLNMTDGGDGVTGMKRSESTRQKMRESWSKTRAARLLAQSKGRDTAEYKEKRKTLSKQIWEIPGHKDKVIASQKARFATQESKEKRSLAAKAMWEKRKHRDNA